MKVALDASPLVESTGGIRRYTLELWQALRREFPEDSFDLVEPLPGRWWSSGLPRVLKHEGFDLFHGTDFAVPYLPVVPAVMTVHDLSPWHPEWRDETSPRVRRRTPWLLRLGLAAMVITPTEAVRREVIARFGLAAERVRAVPHGVDPRFRPQPQSAPGGHLLVLGTQGKRKNLAAAMAAAREAGVELHVAGRGDWPASSGADGVRYLGPVPDEDLPALLAGTLALLFPSHYEGFGLPVLEAMACGTPVIASKDPALVEVAGGAALHCDADDVRAWAEAIGAVRAGRASWSARGVARAAGFTWNRSARQTRAVYEEALQWRRKSAR